MPELKLTFPKAKSIIADYGEDVIRKCAAQNSDPLLKQLTIEVIEVFEAGGGSKCQ